VLLFHKNSGWGMPPDPPTTFRSPPDEAARHGPSPEVRGRTFVSRAIGVLAGPDRRTGLPDLLRLCARRSSPSPGRAEPVPPTGTFGRDSFRPGWERIRPRLKERTESVPEAGGTGAEAMATPPPPPRRSTPRTHPKPTVGGRVRGLSDPTEVAEPPNRERCRSGVFVGGVEGGGAPLASRECSTSRVLARRTLRASSQALECLRGAVARLRRRRLPFRANRSIGGGVSAFFDPDAQRRAHRIVEA